MRILREKRLQVKKRKNIKIYEYTTMTDIVEEDGICSGIVATAQDGTEMKIFAPDTILASGGSGGRYKHATNFPHLTGDALDVAKKHGIRLEHLYAVGETSCNGVQGANRLASNSLLESLVFAKRAANRISGRKNEVKPEGSVK